MPLKDKHARRKYKKDWMRRYRAAHPEKYTIAGGRSSRAKKLPRKLGQCTACGEVKPATEEFFQPLKNSKGWTGLSSECRECRRKRFRVFYGDNQEAQIARAIEWGRQNPEKKNARDMARYAMKLAPQMPSWADQRKIETIYAIADFLTIRTGVPHQVDHVYPLRGQTCCGLHVEHNLRVITARVNQQKGNRLDPDFDTWANRGVDLSII